jgi:hypothetical protein
VGSIAGGAAEPFTCKDGVRGTTLDTYVRKSTTTYLCAFCCRGRSGRMGENGCDSWSALGRPADS